MAWMEVGFSFSIPITEKDFRDALAGEVGRRAASARNIDVVVSSGEDGTFSVVLGSLDPVAIVYSEKVGAALGVKWMGPRLRPLPEWAATPWVELGLWRRFRLWLGPTQL